MIKVRDVKFDETEQGQRPGSEGNSKVDIPKLDLELSQQQEEKKEVKRNEEEGEKPVLPATSKTTEFSHGGDESTGSIENSPNPGGEMQSGNTENDGNIAGTGNVSTQQQVEGNQGDSSTNIQKQGEAGRENENQNNDDGHGMSDQEDINETYGFNEEKNTENNDENEYDNESEEEDESYDEDQAPSYMWNTNEVVSIGENIPSHNLALRTALWRFIELLGDDKVSYSRYYPERIVMKFAVRRVINHYPLRYAYGRPIKEKVAVVLDTSGSMDWVADVVDDIFHVLKDREDVIFFTAPNGEIEKMYDRKRGWVYIDHDIAMKMLSNMVVIYFGDYDGANTPIELSWKTRVYWFCPESRYRYFTSHDWVNYSEDEYKGVFARVYNSEELIRAINDILQHIFEQRLFLDYHEDETFYDDDND